MQHRGLSEAGLEMVLIETQRVKGALNAMPIKTDRRDAETMRRHRPAASSRMTPPCWHDPHLPIDDRTSRAAGPLSTSLCRWLERPRYRRPDRSWSTSTPA